MTWARRMLVCLATVAALGGCFMRRSSAPAQQREGASGELLVSAWVKELPGVVDLSLAPDGNCVVALRRDNTLVCMNETGKVAWRANGRGATHVETAPSALLTLAYAPQRPLYADAQAFNSRGEAIGSLAAPGPIRTVAVSDDAVRVALGADNRITVYERQSSGFTPLAIDCAATVRQVRFGPWHSLYVLTENPYTLRRYDREGRMEWEAPLPAGQDLAMMLNGDGTRLVLVWQEGTEAASAVHVEVRASTGKEIWTAEYEGREPTCRIAMGGKVVVLAYEQRVKHQNRVLYERRLAYLDESRENQWVKGGAYGQLLQAAVAAEGEWVVSLDVQLRTLRPRFRVFNARGQRRWSHRCEAPIRIAVSSRPGDRIAAYRTDGVLEMLHINAKR